MGEVFVMSVVTVLSAMAAFFGGIAIFGWFLSEKRPEYSTLGVAALLFLLGASGLITCVWWWFVGTS